MSEFYGEQTMFSVFTTESSGAIITVENSFIEVQGSVLYTMTLILFNTHTGMYV